MMQRSPSAGAGGAGDGAPGGVQPDALEWRDAAAEAVERGPLSGEAERRHSPTVDLVDNAVTRGFARLYGGSSRSACRRDSSALLFERDGAAANVSERSPAARGCVDQTRPGAPVCVACETTTAPSAGAACVACEAPTEPSRGVQLADAVAEQWAGRLWPQGEWRRLEDAAGAVTEASMLGSAVVMAGTLAELADAMAAVQIIGEQERLAGVGSTAAVAVVPLADAVATWTVLKGFHLAAVLRPGAPVWCTAEGRCDVPRRGLPVPTAVFAWPSADELVAPGARNPWIADAPVMTGVYATDLNRFERVTYCREADEALAAVLSPSDSRGSDGQLAEDDAAVLGWLDERARVQYSYHTAMADRARAAEAAAAPVESTRIRREPLPGVVAAATDTEDPPRARSRGVLRLPHILVNGLLSSGLFDTGADEVYSSLQHAQNCGWSVQPLPREEQFEVGLAANGAPICCKNFARVRMRFDCQQGGHYESRELVYLLEAELQWEVVLGWAWLERATARHGETPHICTANRTITVVDARRKKRWVIDPELQLADSFMWRTRRPLGSLCSMATLRRLAREEEAADGVPTEHFLAFAAGDGSLLRVEAVEGLQMHDAGDLSAVAEAPAGDATAERPGRQLSLRDRRMMRQQELQARSRAAMTEDVADPLEVSRLVTVVVTDATGSRVLVQPRGQDDSAAPMLLSTLTEATDFYGDGGRRAPRDEGVYGAAASRAVSQTFRVNDVPGESFAFAGHFRPDVAAPLKLPVVALACSDATAHSFRRLRDWQWVERDKLRDLELLPGVSGGAQPAFSRWVIAALERLGGVEASFAPPEGQLSPRLFAPLGGRGINMASFLAPSDDAEPPGVDGLNGAQRVERRGEDGLLAEPLPDLAAAGAPVQERGPDAMVEESADASRLGPFPHDGAEARIAKLEADYAATVWQPWNRVAESRGELDFRIALKDPNQAPICLPVRRMGPAELQELRLQLEVFHQRGMIRASSSPWGAPVLFAPKKDGTLRFCLDFRALNEVTRRDEFPLPFDDGLFDQLRGASVFSTVDLVSSFWQHRVADDGSIERTTIRTPLGAYEFLVMPMGATGAPAHQQRVMMEILRPYLYKFAVIFIDDILVYSRSVEEHEGHLRLIMDALWKHRFLLKRKKCILFQKQVEFLGHEVSAAGVVPVQDKIATVREWPSPVDLQTAAAAQKAVRGFVGLAGYYSDFVDGYSELMAPLTRLQSDKVADVRDEWDARCDTAMREVKLALTSFPVLRVAQPDKPYHVFVDASAVAVGAVLMQEGDDDGRLHPIAFASHKLTLAERRYGATARELLGMVTVLRRWRHYLVGAPKVYLRTDCKPLTWLLSQKDLLPMHARWLDLFGQYELDISHIPGVKNVVADVASRRADFETFSAVVACLSGAVQVGSLNAPAVGPDSAVWRDAELRGVVAAVMLRGAVVESAIVAADTPRGTVAPLTRAAARAAAAEPVPSVKEEGSPAAERADAAEPPSEAAEVELPRVDTQLDGAALEPELGQLAAPLDYDALVTRLVFGYQGDALVAQWEALREAGETAQAERLFVVHNGLLFRPGWHGRHPRLLYVPDSCADVRRELIWEAHSPPFSGHLGRRRTLQKVGRHFWWPRMHQTVKLQLQSCESCATNKHSVLGKRAALSPNAVPMERWQACTMDFMTGIPRTRNGYDCLMIVTDRLTKRMVLVPCDKTVTGPECARLFLQYVVREHGLPEVFISDRDPRFTAEFWSHLVTSLGSRLMMSTAGRAQTDGQSERGFQTTTTMLRHYCNEERDDWDEHLWAVEFAYNDSLHEAIGTTPFQADLGRDPATPVQLLLRAGQDVTEGRTREQTADLRAAGRFAARMRARLADVRRRLREANLRMVAQAGPPRSRLELAKGDLVYVHRDALGAAALPGKLAPRYHPEPVRVLESVANGHAYRLALPKEWTVWPVISVHMLQRVPREVQREYERRHGSRMPAAADDATARVPQQLEPRRNGDGWHELYVTLRGKPPARLSVELLPHIAFRELQAMARRAEFPHFLGCCVVREFESGEDDGAMRAYGGLVTAYDPSDKQQQFCVLYEDGDEEWITAAMLGRLATVRLGANREAYLRAVRREEDRAFLEQESAEAAARSTSLGA
jgi:hypothetical protein